MKRLPTPTKDIFQEDISINNNENVLTEKNHIPGNNNQFNLNSRDNLLKNDNRDKNKQTSNVRPDCSVSSETSTQKLNIEIVGNSMIIGINPVGLSSKRKNISRIKPYGGAISEDLVDRIPPTLRRKPDVIVIQIGTMMRNKQRLFQSSD